MLPNDDCDLDAAPIAVVPGSAGGAGEVAGYPMSPTVLADYLDAAYFVSSDDRDSDSFDTQLRAWREESLRRAALLLEGQAAADRLAILEAFRRHVAWLLPSGHRVVVTASSLDDVDVAVEATPDTVPQSTV